MYQTFCFSLIVTLTAFATAATAAPQPLHAYEFEGNFTDSGTGDIAIIPQGGTLADGIFEFDPMYPGDYNEGLTLENAAITDIGVYSIEMRIKFVRLRNESPPGSYGPDQSWIKIIDYTDNLEAYGFYAEDNIRWEGPGEEGIVEFIATTGTPGGFHYPGVSPLSTIAADDWFHLVVTRDAGRLFTCYVDGEPVFDFVDERDDAVLDAPNRVLHFLQPDQFTVDRFNVYEVAKGSLDYVRLYDEALSASEVGELFAPALPGDFSGDGVVNLADYTLWRDQLGSTTPLPNDTTNGTANGTIGSAQYELWSTQFAANNSTLQATKEVPEPASLWVALAVLSIFAQRRSF